MLTCECLWDFAVSLTKWLVTCINSKFSVLVDDDTVYVYEAIVLAHQAIQHTRTKVNVKRHVSARPCEQSLHFECDAAELMLQLAMHTTTAHAYCRLCDETYINSSMHTCYDCCCYALVHTLFENQKLKTAHKSTQAVLPRMTSDNPTN
jgi:hypothetical protein